MSSSLRSLSKRLQGSRSSKVSHKHRHSEPILGTQPTQNFQTPITPPFSPQIPTMANAELPTQFERISAPVDKQEHQASNITGTEITKENLFQPVAGTDLRMETDRTLYSMPMPENVDAMTDLIKLHKSGDNFPYVGVVGSEGESLDATRSRLLAMKPQYNTVHVPEFSVEACPLIDTKGEFSMKSLLEYAKETVTEIPKGRGLMPTIRGTQKFEIKKRYAQIKSIRIIYTPNMSSTADYCKFWVTLNDTRMINSSKSGPSVAIVSNQEGVVEMGCDYCVSSEDMGSFILSYLLERDIMKSGHQWGTMTLFFSVIESDVPFQSVKRDTMAVYRMPVSTLVERETDPDKVDISFTAADIKALRELFKSGDVVDVDAPQSARLKKSSYSKSSLRGTQKGETLARDFSKSEDWGFLAGARKPKVDAMNASISVPEGEEEEDIDPESLRQTKVDWSTHQEKLRQEQEKRKATVESVAESLDQQDELTRLFASQQQSGKGVRFQEDGV
jgi:hypothetical protein